MALGCWQFAMTGALAALALAIFVVIDDFKAQPLQFTPAPRREGPLRLKPIREGIKYAEGLVNGPESIAIHKGALYTCVADAKCVRIVNGVVVQSIALTPHNCNGMAPFTHCGRPLGIRHWKDDLFLVADSVYGIYAVDFAKGTAEVVFSAQNRVDNTVQKFPDDLDFLDNDTIVYSDASTKWTINDFIQPMLENGRDGRIIQLSLSTGKAKVLVDGFSFPNGVQVHPDRKSLLIAESVTAKIHRFYFAGPRKGQLEVFCDSLPGFPDNVRPSADGKSLYVAMYSSRWHADGDNDPTSASLFDFLAPHPWLRTALGVAFKYMPSRVLEAIVQSSSTEYGVVVELDLNGKIIDSYHDPSGSIIGSISQVTDDGEKYLYLGSFANNYIGRIRKH